MTAPTLTVDTRDLVRLSAQFADMCNKQTRFATMLALNDAAKASREAVQKEITRVFDRPTAWIVKSPWMLLARKNKLAAKIDLQYWSRNKQGVTADHVLHAEIEGGPRHLKRSEVALRRMGLLPAGMATVPGAGAKLDAHGNMQAGQLVQIMAWFRAFGEQGYKSNIDAKGRARLGKDNKRTGARGFAYFALTIRRNNLAPGIYRRTRSGFGSAVIPVLLFVRMPAYRKRFDFYRVAGVGAVQEFERAFPARFDQAMRTAKK